MPAATTQRKPARIVPDYAHPVSGFGHVFPGTRAAALPLLRPENARPFASTGFSAIRRRSRRGLPYSLMNVLIVDDRANFARVTAVALRNLGVDSVVAHSLNGAQQALAEGHVDAVLLDVNLGMESGFDLLPLLKTRMPRLPVVMVSAQEREEIAEEALRRGAFDCLGKPFGLDELRELLGRLRSEVGAAGTQATP